MLTPKDIRHKKFSMTGWFHSGYDPEEVDDFLDRVGETIGALCMIAVDGRNVRLPDSVRESALAVKRRTAHSKFMKGKRHRKGVRER